MDTYSNVIARINALVQADRAPDHVRRYLARPGGRKFDELIDRDSPEFTEANFKAVQELSVSVRHSARTWLRGDGRNTVQELLARIPAGLDIWECPAGGLRGRSRAGERGLEALDNPLWPAGWHAKWRTRGDRGQTPPRQEASPDPDLRPGAGRGGGQGTLVPFLGGNLVRHAPSRDPAKERG